jgi:hypothetical protein
MVSFCIVYNTYLTKRASGKDDERGFLSNILLTYAFWTTYHFTVMQFAAIATLTNVGSMLCAAISDPFGQTYYRVHGLWHQFLCGLVSGTIYHLVAKLAVSHARGDKKAD